MPILEQIYSRPTNYFSISHFLVGFDKCDRLHGHNYGLKIRVTYNSDDPVYTADFRIINKWIKEIIARLDHNILLPGGSNHIVIESVMDHQNWQVTIKEKKYSFPKKDVIILKDFDQITAENLSIYIHNILYF